MDGLLANEVAARLPGSSDATYRSGGALEGGRRWWVACSYA